jgi:DNA-binding Lrp family transcriptional regulator
MSEQINYDERILEIVRTAKRPPTLARIARATGLSDLQVGEALTRLRHTCRIKTVTVGEAIGYQPYTKK